MRRTALIAKMAMLDHVYGCRYCGWTGDVLTHSIRDYMYVASARLRNEYRCEGCGKLLKREKFFRRDK